ncbi:MFS general substrate transporter [Penicillium malachiteum]|uniref:MFS general substrate transporter n=1 Tax=Penicillium malachiteum TaxID=1324776 RepID=UPI002546C635|nr:MFS general substrate transporter [Penicillium malachiteum]KAJ5729545.1 MFS general substrate transporter [Penicillium malachiteum]
MCGFTIATGFIKTFPQLIACRLLFGIAYGGTYGLVMSTVLESVPEKARGVVAGFTQQGFSAGYLLASGFHLAMNPYGWRPLFWLCGGLTAPVIVLHLITPTHSVVMAQSSTGNDAADERGAVGGNLSFVKKLRYVLRYHWKPFVSVEFWEEFSEVSFPTVSIPNGWLLEPAFSIGAFWLQFFYGAAIGNLGNLLQQLCPHPGIRAAFTGVAYNIGNAVSSCAPSIETALGERFRTSSGMPDYARTQMGVVGVVIFFLVMVLAIMPLESLNKSWDQEDPNQDIPTQAVNSYKLEALEQSDDKPTCEEIA